MSEILLEVADGVAIITLNAPGRRNALTPDMVRELVSACDQVDADESVGAVVVKANGESFCAGAHRAVLTDAGSDPSRGDNYLNIGLIYAAFVRIGSLLPATIAAVRGHAIGAGMNLMLATDLRVVSETARVASGFLRIGIHPGGGHYSLLGRLAGREAAAAMGLFGQEIDGRRAAAIGLAWDAVSEAEVEPRAVALAHAIAVDPELCRAAARSLRIELGPPGIPWPAALEVEMAVQLWSLRRNAMRGTNDASRA